MNTRYCLPIFILLMSAQHSFAAVGDVWPLANTCPGFKSYELCFEEPRDGKARAEYLSKPFYALILKSAPRCSITESDRLEIQEMFPNNKVFSNRFECDTEDSIAYTNVSDKHGFVAVYAGSTSKQAKKRLAEIKATGKFPGANLRKMQVKRVYP